MSTRFTPAKIALIASLMADGLTDEQIGERLGIKPRTARQYRSKVRSALGTARKVCRTEGPIAGRFAAKVDTNGPVPTHRPELGACHVWIAGLNTGGYGIIHDVAGEIGPVNTKYRAHRAAWIMANGAIPDGLIVRHKCDRPTCVNVAHLELGTDKQNMDDKYERGRAKRATDPAMIRSVQRARERRAAIKAGQPLQPYKKHCSHCWEPGHSRPKCPSLKEKAA